MSEDVSAFVNGATLRFDLRPGDLGTVLTLHGVHYTAEYGYDLTFEGYVAETLGHFARPYDAGERVWIAEVVEQAVGCVALIRHSKNQARVRWFLVVPRARGNGLGHRLLAEAVRFARLAGYSSVLLETTSEQTTAGHLYLAMGFVLTSEAEADLWGKTVTVQRYELTL